MEKPIDHFIQTLSTLTEKPFSQLEHRQFAGASFFMVQLKPPFSKRDLEQFLLDEMNHFFKNTIFTYELTYLRTSKSEFIYRLQLRVPDEKSFCCGNQCPHCILFKKSSN
ncbi:hypothetical protein [Hazenella coriacea]|uniref:Uncharacterized protein n=1 Tax=Hazenella coriacea TaxID=1179467 RepID=A0A4R3L7K4_9BACL|nr:hypothetical protein [Hazenella coriacea]TCS95015.1 hypothetical protein EDD58_103440 [Hazenella coriacea]